MPTQLAAIHSHPTISETPIYKLDHRQRYSLPDKKYAYKQRRDASPPPQPPSTPVDRWTPSEIPEECRGSTESLHFQPVIGTCSGAPSSLSSSSFEDIEISTEDDMSDDQTKTFMKNPASPMASPVRHRCNHATSYSCDHEQFCRRSDYDRPKSKVYRTSLTRKHAVVRRERTYCAALPQSLSPSPKPIFGEPTSPKSFNSPSSSTTRLSDTQDDYYNWGEVSYFEDWDDDSSKKSRLRSFSLTSSFLKGNAKNSIGRKQKERQRARRSISDLLKDLSCAR